MIKTTYQKPEIRDANDNIIQQGAFGKNTALANATNDGWIDYVANDLEALYDNINGARIYVANKDALPATGDLSAMYIAEDTGKWYLWDGQKYIETDNARKIADEAIAARDAAKASQSAAKTSETNAKTSETNAAASKSAAATSATNAANSASTATTQANTAKAWATATTSPDGAADTSSTTGKTQSAKSWAMYSKDRATASASSASAAAGSASAAKTSETNAASSKTAAATSATNAANSAKAAADSATAAANSAREQQADWNVTDTKSKAFVKNKPSIKLSGLQNVSASLVVNPTVASYNEGIRLNQSAAGWASIYLGGSLNTTAGPEEHAWGIFRDPSYALGIWPNDSSNKGKKGLYLPLNGRATLDGKTVILAGDTVGKATADAAGNNIQSTYATKQEVGNYLPLSGGTLTGDVDITGDLSVAGSITGNVTGDLTGTASGNLALSGGSITGDVDITGDLSVSGAIYSSDPASGENSGQVPTTAWVQKLVAEALKLGVLPGTVTAFSGTVKDGYPVNKNTGLVDKEWHLCDGTNGTPDLRNRFIYGGTGTNNGTTGGEASVKLTVETIPAHSHTGTTSTNGNHSHTVTTFKEHHKINGNNYDGYCTGSTDRTTSTDGNHQHSLNINSTGGGQPHNNMPPYYTLAYIMKL